MKNDAIVQREGSAVIGACVLIAAVLTFGGLCLTACTPVEAPKSPERIAYEAGAAPLKVGQVGPWPIYRARYTFNGYTNVITIVPGASVDYECGSAKQPQTCVVVSPAAIGAAAPAEPVQAAVTPHVPTALEVAARARTDALGKLTPAERRALGVDDPKTSGLSKLSDADKAALGLGRTS